MIPPLKSIRLVMQKNGVEYLADNSVLDVSKEINAIEQTKNYLRKDFGVEIECPLRVVFLGNSNNMGLYAAQCLHATQQKISEISGYPGYTALCYSSENSPIVVTLRNISVDNVGSDQLFVLAHETAHAFQLQFAKENTFNNKWLAEGMADVIAANVLNDENGYKTRWIKLLREFPVTIQLQELRQKETFETNVRNHTLYPIYRIADLAVLKIKEKYGNTSLKQYLCNLGNIKDVERSFYEAFGISIDDYETEFEKYFTAEVKS